MANNAIVDYINKESKKGHHISKIKERLIKAGHKTRDVEEALAIHHHKKHVLNITSLSIGIAVVIAIVIMANVDWDGDGNVQPNTSAQNTNTQPVANTNEQSASEVDELMNAAINNLDSNWCYRIKNSDSMVECMKAVDQAKYKTNEPLVIGAEYESIINHAIETKDISQCDQIKDERIRKECIEAVEFRNRRSGTVT